MTIETAPRDEARLPDGPAMPTPLQMMWWLRRPTEFLDRCHQRYGDWFTLRVQPGTAFVLVSDPESVRELFTDTTDRLRAGEANVVLEPLLGPNSVLLLDGDRHRRERRLLMPPFHGERMHAYAAVMEAATRRAMARFPIGRPFSVHSEMQEITLDVILRTVYGLDHGERLDALRARLSSFLETVSNPLLLLPIFRLSLGPLQPLGALEKRLSAIDGLIFEQIQDRRAAPDPDRHDILSLLAAARDEDGQPMKSVELRDEMMTLLVAGHETTATALSWAFFHLLGEPAVLARVQDELDRVMDGSELHLDRLSELPYLDAVIRETMRVHPVIPLVGRRLQVPVRISGRVLPPGTVAAPAIYLAHRRAEVWPNPTRFDPERFLAKRASPSVYFPFGGGVRRCIGMAFALYEMKVVLATILSRLTPRRVPGRIRVARRSITLVPSRGMPLRFDTR